MLFALVGLGCYPSEADFNSELLRITCRIYLECASEDDAYSLDVSTQEECEALIGSYSVDPDDYYEGCTYDKKAADQCLDIYDETTCGDYQWDFEACESVYTC